MYICKVPSLEEINQKWDYEIAHASEDAENWIRWKQTYVARYTSGKAIAYYGLLNGTIICEATACTDPEGIQNASGLVNACTAYLCAFRTLPQYQKKGYFSRLFRFMIQDLVQRGIRYATVGAEPEETENLAIYAKLGFTEYLKQATEQFPDGTAIQVNYYRKQL